MTPEENILNKTLNLIVMLARARKNLPNLSEEEKATLSVTKQIITDAGLTVPEFTNSLHKISAKGYFWHIVFFDDHLRTQVNDFLSGSQYDDVMRQLEVLNNDETSKKLQEFAHDNFLKMAPKSVGIENDVIDEEPIVFTDMLQDGIAHYKNLRNDEIALIILMPFRNIEDLYNRMSKGENFDEIKDSDTWYDPNKFIFHIEGETIETSYQDKANIEHYVLERLLQDFNNGVIWYDDIENRSPRSLKDALLKFVGKNKKLESVFTVHQDRLEFSKEAFK